MSAKPNEIGRRRSRRWWMTGVVLIVISIASVVLVASSGANLASSTFEGDDGNLVVDGPSPATDWASLPASALTTLIDTPTGPSDNSFTQGTHEDDPNVSIAAGSIPPNKNDLTRAYLASEAVGSETFLYLAWERLTNTGSANIDFELNQNVTPGWDASTLGALTIVRTEGDILITYDFGGSGTPDLGLLTWLTTGNGHTNNDCEASGGKLPCWGNRVDLTNNPSIPNAVGAVNAGTILEPIAGGSLTAGLFGEAKIDLTLVPGLFQQNTCKAFGSMFVKSRSSGSSIDAELKDFIAPNPIHVSNCGTIELKKHWVGTPDSVELNVGSSQNGTQVASTTATTDGATTGAKAVEDGTYYMSEPFTTPANAANYTSSLACTRDGQAAAADGNNGISVTAGHTVVCTFTNTRNTGTIEVVKHLSPIDDPGRFNLLVDGTVGKTDAANNDTTGAVTVNTGSHAVSEAIGSVGTLSNYTTTNSCSTNGGAAVTGTGTSVAGITVAKGDHVVCTFTNTRDTGTIEVIKHLDPATDPGRFNLLVDGTVKKADAANNDTTGAVAVNTGTHAVSEAIGSVGTLSNYTTTNSCSTNGGTAVTGTGTSVAGITVAKGDHVVCTFTNTRNAGTIEVIKHLDPATDDGLFDLSVDGTVKKADASNNDTTGAVAVNTGSHAVSEAEGTGTSSSDYVSSYSCVNGESPVASGNGTSVPEFAVGSGDAIVCTFTNHRLPTIMISKRVLPATDTGTFDFTIDSGEGQIVLNNGTDGYGNNDSTDAINVSLGSHTIDESGNGDTLGSDYASTWSCSNEQSGSGTSIDLSEVGYGDNIVCTFTNTRLATLIVVKNVDNSNGGGSKAPGDFSLHVTGNALNVAAPGTSAGTTYPNLLPGLYTVSEDAVAGYNLSGITGCDNGGAVLLSPGQTVTCTLTNKSNAPPPPPPPAPPAPRIDLSITKNASPNPATVGGNVTWTMVVTNNGPSNATGVTVADSVPAGMTFVSVATSQGTCAGPTVVSCQLGNMAVGTSVTITLVTTATTPGTITNTATTVGNEAETNTANNTASASTVVNGPFVPPVKPVVYCTAVAVSPKTLFVGRSVLLTIHVAQHGKAVAGVRVRIKGSTISGLTKPSNKKGIVSTKVNPKRAGIVTIAPVSQKSCKNPRIGVTGVFTPPVTG